MKRAVIFMIILALKMNFGFNVINWYNIYDYERNLIMPGKSSSELYNRLLDNPLFQNTVKFEVMTFKPNDRILQKGKKHSYFCLLKKGTAKVVLSHEIDPAIHPIISDIHSNEIFGAMGLFDDFPASADVVSVDETEIITIDKQSFLAFINANAELGNEILIDFLQVLAKRVYRLNEIVFSLLKQGIELQKKK